MGLTMFCHPVLLHFQDLKKLSITKTTPCYSLSEDMLLMLAVLCHPLLLLQDVQGLHNALLICL